MCGIAGILNLDRRPVDRAVLKGMADIIHHRGPDDEGYLVKDNLGLAHKRLAIIDLSADAHQPMQNENGQLWLVYNGEIYNYVELMADLKALGHVFRSHSDAEVALHAFEEWGPDCVSRFSGMWAMAIWDDRNKALFCCRDRFGIKPFYYILDDDRFVFASEIKALFAGTGIRRVPNERAIYRYLAKGYGYVDTTEETFFSGVKQLKPAHYMYVSEGRAEYKRYWRLDHKVRAAKGPRESAEEFLALLKDSVRLHMRSDVPVGLSLSGGLDSGALASLMPGVSGCQIECFSVCFKDRGFDEKEYIDLLMKDARLVPNFIFPEPATLMKELEKIVWHQDEPYSGASVFSQWEVMRRAGEKGIKVLLTGQGGDETLAGYYKYYPYFLLDLIKDAKFPLFFKTFRHLGKGNGYTKEDALLAMAKIVVSRSLAGIIAPRIKSGMLGKPRFLDAGFAERNRSAEHRLYGSTSSLLDEELENSLVTSPLPGLLHIDDRNSMAHSIESRPPFLDHRLVEYLFSLPYEMKIADGYTKYILREALRGILPEKIRTRRDKMGFATPMKVWFKGELAATVSDILRSAAFRKRGIFDTKEVEYALRLHAGGAKDLSFTIWSWVNLEIWFRLFIDGDRDA